MTTAPATKVTTLPEPRFPMLTRLISKPLFPDDQRDDARISQLTTEWLTANPSATRQQIAEAAIGIAARVCRNGTNSPTVWTVGKPHPLVPECKVIRMFASDIDVEIYSAPESGGGGMRNRVPMDKILLIEEAMPIETLVEELAVAESDEDDDDEPEDPNTDVDTDSESTTPVVQTSNGHQTPVS